MKSCGSSCETFDPSKLEIYGGAGPGSPYDSIVSTSQAFYGVLFDPQANVTFSNNTTLNFHGSINVRQIRTDQTVKIHWDSDLKEAFSSPPPIEGACVPPNCLPKIGTWDVALYDYP